MLLTTQRLIFIVALALVLIGATILFIVYGLILTPEWTPTDYSDVFEITQPHGDYQLWLNTIPEGASVSTAATVLGTTPLSMDDLEDREYRLTIVLPGYRTIDTVANLSGGEKITFKALRLSRLIEVVSVPAGANVKLSGEMLSAPTPVEIAVPSLDTFNLELTHVDLEPVRLTGVDLLKNRWNIPHGETWRIESDSSTSIARITGVFTRRILVRSRPMNASMYLVDKDSLMGVTGDSITLPAGQNRYRLTKSGMNDLVISIDPVNLVGSGVEFNLERNISVTSFRIGADPNVDVGATVTKADHGIRVVFLDRRTPVTVTLPAEEHRLYFSCEGFADTSIAVGATENLVRIGLRAIDEPDVPEDDTLEVPVEVVARGIAVNLMVVDKDSKAGIAGAEVVAEFRDENRKVLLGETNRDGILKVSLPEGKYRFEALAEGYKDGNRKVTIDDPDEPDVIIELKPR